MNFCITSDSRVSTMNCAPWSHCGILRCCFLSICFWTLSGNDTISEGKNRSASRQNNCTWALGHWLPTETCTLKHTLVRLVLSSLACKFKNISLASEGKCCFLILVLCLISQMHTLSSYGCSHIPITLEMMIKGKPWNIFIRHHLTFSVSLQNYPGASACFWPLYLTAGDRKRSPCAI